LLSKKNLKVDKSDSSNLFEYLAKQIEYSWNENNNCMLVAGATNPNDLKKIRECAPTLPILIPGVGAQGGDLKLSVQNASDSNKSGILIAVSRSIIYSDNPRKEAGNIRDEINSYF
jgi:orotidine-5'-phosphate decarboxylase